MDYIELPKEACFRPLFSPRTTLSRINKELEQLSTNLAINMDKYILGFMRDDFDRNEGQMGLVEFVASAIKHMKSWQKELIFREEKMGECLRMLFTEADTRGRGSINWAQFNGMLIEKGLNLKSLRNQEPGSNSMMRQIGVEYSRRHNNPISKLVSLGDRIAMFTEQSTSVEFLTGEGKPAGIKPIALTQQTLVVETGVVKRGKEGHKEIQKKDMVVAEYRNVMLDMIYVKDHKYDMLVTSSSDFTVRGWEVSGGIPQICRQPQNEDEKMEHQFQAEIHTMAWDGVNEVLYCCGKTPKIYQWMVKTDSERELFDPEGHTDMISAMIMMPKLQFLATGGYDGRMVLWDTISQTKKFVYRQHTRSIASMAFHQGLILLFTAAYDHSICVWNPYIQSLVHKIVTNINVIELQLIPNTNLLIALDHDSNVKIRQINKFTLVSSFTVDRHDHAIEPTSMIALTHPLRYYFGGIGIAGYQYVHVDSNPLQDAPLLSLHHRIHPTRLYAPLKNHLLEWDLLTGHLNNTLRNITEHEITAVQLMPSLGVAAVGDYGGNLSLRKLQNGVLVKQLYRHKQPVMIVMAREEAGHVLVVSVSQEGEIAVFERDQGGQFMQKHILSIRKFHPLATITALAYSDHRSILAVATNIGQVYFIDVDKGKKLNQFNCPSDVASLHVIPEEQVLLCVGRKGEVSGVFMPPHQKKYKASCSLELNPPAGKINTVVLSSNKRCYAGCENGEVVCFRVTGEGQGPIGALWRVTVGQAVRSLVLMEEENCMLCLSGTSVVTILSCEGGSTVASIEEKNQVDPAPLVYLDQQKLSLYYKPEDSTIPLHFPHPEQRTRQIFDPFFYTRLAQQQHPDMEMESNPQWSFQPAIHMQVQQRVKDSMRLQRDLETFKKQPKKPVLVKSETQHSFDVSKAVEITKKWERQREQDEMAKTGKPSLGGRTVSQSLHNLRGSKMNSFAKAPEPRAGRQGGKQSALFRLGMALKQVDEGDERARVLLQMAERQGKQSKNNSGFRLPRIGR